MSKRLASPQRNAVPFAKRPKSDCFTDLASPAPRYDFNSLLDKDNELRRYAVQTGKDSVFIDFSDHQANLTLTRAILRHHFHLELYLPEGHLIPTIPNRVQYLQWAASLLPVSSTQHAHSVLDIGTGPSCIYPMLGTRLFPTWTFVATDTDPQAVQSARRNVSANALHTITILQTEKSGPVFSSRVERTAPSLTVCNPPFHDTHYSREEVVGTPNQLVTEGGELAFICRMATESTSLSSVSWFTTLVGRKADIPKILAHLRSIHVNASQVRTVQLDTGGRTVRWAVAWTFGTATTSTVAVDADPRYPWRVRLRVQPSRAYANQLQRADIADLCIISFKDRGWNTPIQPGDRSHNGVVTLFGSDASNVSGAQIEIHIIGPTPLGTFTLTMKAECRAKMTISSFREVGTMLATTISQLLNEIPP